MPDKQQNIFVNFKYNTAELEKGTNLVNRANDANNKLQQSAQKAGAGASQAYRGATQSIGAMQMQLARLKTSIELATNPKRVEELSRQFRQLKTELDRATKAAFENSKSLRQVQNETKVTTQSFGELYAALRVLVAGGIAKELLNITLNMASLSGKVDGVTRAFDRIPGATFLLENLRTATQGAVTDLELMQKTLMSQSYKIPLQQLPKLLEFAALKAQQTGQEVNHLVNYIVTGIGLRSVRRLDDLGFTASRLREALGGVTVQAASMGQVVDAVTKLMNEDLEKFGGLAVTSETKVNRIKKSWEDLRLVVAERLTNSSFLEFLQQATDGLIILAKALPSISWKNFIPGYGVMKGLNDFRDNMKGIALDIAAQEEAMESMRNFQKQLGDVEAENLKTTQLQIVTNVEMINRNNEQVKGFQKKLEVLKKNSYANLVDIKESEAAISSYGVRTEALKRFNAMLVSSISLLQQQTDPDQLGIIEAKKAEIDAIEEAIEKTNKLSDLSSRVTVGNLITSLAIAQAELDELLHGVQNIEFKVKFDLNKLRVDFKRGVDFIKTQTKDGADFFVEVPVGPSKDKAKVLKDFEALTEILKGIPSIPVPVTPVPTVPKDFGDHLADAIKESQGDLINAGTQIFSDQLISLEDAEVASLENRLNNLRNFYDEQQLLAGDNDRAKQALRLKEERETADLQRKIAQKQKEARRFSVIIDTAAGIAKAFATAPFPLALVQAALIAAQGASQLAIINRTQARFAKGVIDLKGPGTGTSDSIHARLSRGESVMTAKETKGSMGILKDIRAKKLNDNVLQNLKLTGDGVRNVGLDDSRIVKEIRDLKNSQPNIIEQSGRIYKQYNKGKDYKRKVRIKNLGY